ncbi:hypothetical protein B0H12DRAFT_596111 [Mycena haematopus]|nr:hypothetical protein B0H12DRAFT_596111 [Mycena haematopus]
MGGSAFQRLSLRHSIPEMDSIRWVYYMCAWNRSYYRGAKFSVHVCREILHWSCADHRLHSTTRHRHRDLYIFLGRIRHELHLRNQLRLLARVPRGQGIPALALALLSFTLPYTPRWLIRKGRAQEALKTLAWLRKMPEESEIIQLEYTEIQAEAMFEAEMAAEKFPGLVGGGAFTQFKLQVAQFRELFTTIHMFRRTAIACLTQFFQQMSGIDAIVYYAPTIFQSLGLGAKTVSLLAAGVIGVVFVISTLPAIATIDRVGRRPLLIIGGSGMALMLILIAALTATYQPEWTSSGAAWATATFIWLYVAFFGTSWGPVSWTVISEVFPLSTRAHGVALAASANWITNFAVSLVVPDMLNNITYGTYLFFLMFMLMGIAFAIWVLPETFGKSLEEMDLAFGSGEGQADVARMERILVGLKTNTNTETERSGEKEKRASDVDSKNEAV